MTERLPRKRRREGLRQTGVEIHRMLWRHKQEGRRELVKPGMDEASFVDPDAVKDAYLCGICNDVLRNPVQCKKGHTCCGDCLNTWLDSKKTCPTCRDPLQKKDLSENLLVRNMINDLEVYCENCDAAEPPAKAARVGAASASGSGGGGRGGGSASRPAASQKSDGAGASAVEEKGVEGAHSDDSLLSMSVAALKALVQSEPFGNQTIPARGSKKADLIETAMSCLGPIGLPCPERIKALAGM